jgi:LmbE family N-acetylglucosaminyl deacetylase
MYHFPFFGGSSLFSENARCFAIQLFIFSSLTTFVNILAIGAHPDDIELGCGGLMLKTARQGHNVFMYTATRGSASGDPKQRTKELTESAARIGVRKLWVDDFEDTKLAVHSELINRIEDIVGRTEADIIVSHAGSDIHHDHKAIANAIIEAGRFVPNILSYEIPLTKEFKPQVFCDISDVIEDKIELIKLFKSQRDKIYLKANAIKGLAEYRALQSRLNGRDNRTILKESSELDDPLYVEAFEVTKMCFDREFKLYGKPRSSLLTDNITLSNVLK